MLLSTGYLSKRPSASTGRAFTGSATRVTLGTMRFLVLLLMPGLALAQFSPPPDQVRGIVKVETPDGGPLAVAVPAGVSVTSAPPVTGTVAVNSIPAVTGTVAVSSAPPITGTVGVSTLPPVDIGSSVRLDVSASTAPGDYLAVAGDSAGARLEVAVPAGVTIPGGVVVTNTVGVTGAVELGPVASALLAGRTCTYGAIGHVVLDGGVQDIAGMTNRTGITMVAHDFGNGVDYVSCWPGLPDGGESPNCTVGLSGRGVPIHEGGSASFDVSNAYVVRCLTCNHSGSASTTTALLGGANSQCTP